MITVFTISLREFLEVFFIIGIFHGLSKKLSLKKEKEILYASIVGILLSILIPILFFLMGEKMRVYLQHENIERIEAILMIISSVFIAYVALFLHHIFSSQKTSRILKAQQNLERNAFDISLFFTIIFLIIQEGLEIGVFTTTSVLFSRYIENVVGLLLGLFVSAIIGLSLSFTTAYISMKKLIGMTQILIISVGAGFLKNGIGELVEQFFNYDISRFLPVHIPFIPPVSSTIGHYINNLTGIEQNFSVVKLGIIIVYIYIVTLFLRKHESAS